MRFDTHIHLDVMSDEAIGTALFAAPDYRAFIPGCDPNDVAKALARFASDSRIALGTAIHPWELGTRAEEGGWLHPQDDPRWPLLLAQANDPRIVAIGECGLDLFRHTDEAMRARAEAYFVAQIGVALAVHKPLVLHCVRAHARCAELLRLHRADRVGGIVHAFAGSAEEAAAYRRLGFTVSIGAAVTREASRRVRAVAAALPDDSFVIETDAPYMRAGEGPAWSGSVDHIEAVAATVATLRGTTAEAIFAMTAARGMHHLGAASLPLQSNLGNDRAAPHTEPS